jgi:hypothetical protein
MVRSLTGRAGLAPMKCWCGAQATANGAECSTHYLERLRSVQTAFAPTRSIGAGQIDPTLSRQHESRLEDYRRVRYEGNQPASTRRADIEVAKRESDRTGVAHRADRAALDAAGRA